MDETRIGFLFFTWFQLFAAASCIYTAAGRHAAGYRSMKSSILQARQSAPIVTSSCPKHLQGVALDSLFGYWPFVEPHWFDGCCALASTKPRDRGAAAQIVQQLGPFGESKTLAIVSGQQTGHSNLAHLELDWSSSFSGFQNWSLQSFTVAFFLFTTVSENQPINCSYESFNTVIFEYSHLGSIFRLTACKRHLFLKAQPMGGKSVECHFKLSPFWAWKFVALTYNASEKRVELHNSAGVLADEPVENFEIPHFPVKTILKIGELRNNDQLTCFVQFSRVLSQFEIAKLPCFCRTKGNCSLETAMKLDNSPPKLIGFWPLLQKLPENPYTFGLADTYRGELIGSSSVLNGKAFLAPADALGIVPFFESGILYQPSKPQKPLARFSGLKMTTKRSLSVALMVYVANASSIVETSSHPIFCLYLNGSKIFRQFLIEDGRTTDPALARQASYLVSPGWSLMAFTLTSDGVWTAYTLNNTALKSKKILGFRMPQIGEEFDLEIGPFPFDMAIACMSIFNAILSDNFTSFLPDCNGFDKPSFQVAGIPSPNDALAFFPLDADSRLNDMKGGVNGSVSCQAQLSNEAGPFLVNRTSFTAISPGRCLYEKIKLKPDLTISFYFFLNEAKKTAHAILGFRRARLNVELRYQGSKLYLQTSSHPKGTLTVSYLLLDDFIKLKQWTFYAATFDLTSNIVAIHRATGDLILEKNLGNFTSNLLDGSNRESSFWFGDIPLGDSIACTFLYKKVLSEVEIARLPCSCKTRGFCHDKMPSNINAAEKSTPNLLFFPLSKTHGPLEALNGINPATISRKARLVEEPGKGPSGTSDSCYTNLNEPQHMATYQFSYLTDFSLAFLFFAEKNSPGGEIVGFYENKTARPILQLIYYSGSILVSPGREWEGLLVEVVAVDQSGWSFAGLNYRKAQNKLEAFGLTGPVEAIEDLVNSSAISGYGPVIFSFGKLAVGDRLACILFFNGTVPFAGETISTLERLCKIPKMKAVKPTTPPKTAETTKRMVTIETATMPTTLSHEINTSSPTIKGAMSSSAITASSKTASRYPITDELQAGETTMAITKLLTKSTVTNSTVTLEETTVETDVTTLRPKTDPALKASKTAKESDALKTTSIYQSPTSNTTDPAQVQLPSSFSSARPLRFGFLLPLFWNGILPEII